MSKLVWILRVGWLSLPFATGPLFGDALAATSDPVRRTATLGLWVFWAAGLALTAAPHWRTLAPLRVIAPGAFVAAVWATLADRASGAAVVALGVTALVAVVSLTPEIGASFVNGSSYGDERRVPLRPPGHLLLGPIQLAFGVVLAGMVAGPLLLAARQWVLGGIVAAVGLPLALVAGRSLQALAHRWLVFVPAGVVVHDHLSVSDPVLVKRNAIAHLGPALADTDAVDLTMGALGLALELRVTSRIEMGLRDGRSPTPKSVELDALLVSVARPGLALEEAARRRIRVG